jgi:integrase
MAWVRKLPSGKWAATVRLPGDKKITRSFPLKRTAENWANKQQDNLNRGDWIDPRHGELLVGEWRERCRDGRVLELASRKRDESHWRVHVEPYWADRPLSSILQPDVSAWVAKMQRDGAGADTVIGSVKVLRGLLEQAVAAKLIHFNPARGVKLPRTGALTDRVLEPHEDQILLDAMRRRHGDRPEAALFVELLLDTGLRWEEAAGLHTRNVDKTRRRIHVVDVLERDGSIRPYPKSRAGERDVPIGDDLWKRLGPHLEHRDGLVFTTRLGKPLDYSRWRSRIWAPVLQVPTQFGGHNGMKVLERVPLLDGQAPTPHDMRHTYGTRLAEQGVPQHEIMALMGHKDVRAVQRYTHAGEARFERARVALGRARDGSRLTGGS